MTLLGLIKNGIEYIANDKDRKLCYKLFKERDFDPLNQLVSSIVNKKLNNMDVSKKDPNLSKLLQLHSDILLYLNKL